MTFQENAWYDGKVMKEWIMQQWKPACDGHMLLTLDQHKAQKTDEILSCFRTQCNTETVLVPAGTTGLIQPIDVVFNAPFKAAVERQATMYLQENLDSYVTGKINASERRVLFTKWVGKAWEDVSSKVEMVVRSFRKCGISVAIDGSEDSDININGLENYSVESDDESGDATDEDPEEEEDPFADMD